MTNNPETDERRHRKKPGGNRGIYRDDIEREVRHNA